LVGVILLAVAGAPWKAGREGGAEVDDRIGAGAGCERERGERGGGGDGAANPGVHGFGTSLSGFGQSLPAAFDPCTAIASPKFSLFAGSKWNRVSGLPTIATRGFGVGA
jgi:hypothetical protein